MTDESFVIFQSRPSGHVMALIGIVEVGLIAPSDPFAPFCWRIWLPGCPRQLGRASSAENARAQMRAKIKEWTDAAGLMPVARPEIRVFRPDDWGKIKQAVRP